MQGAGISGSPHSKTNQPIQGEQTTKEEDNPNDNNSIKDPNLMKLQQTWNSRIDTARQLISAKPNESKFVAQTLAYHFNILTESKNSEEMTDDQKKFLSLALSQCNLAGVADLEKLKEVFSFHNKISDESRSPRQRSDTEHDLKEALDNLAQTSRGDSQIKQGTHSMAVERQGFVESDIETNFPDKETQQQIKNTLVLLKFQITSGFDIGPLPDNVVTLKFDSPESIKKFAIYCQYPNENIFTEERSKYESKIDDLNNKLTDEDTTTLINTLKEIVTITSEHSSTPPKKVFSEADLHQIKESLQKKIPDMSRETLLLASFATSLSKEMKGYLKACHILVLKTPEKEEATDASNTDPSASVKNEEVKTEEAKPQELTTAQDLLAKALLDSDAIKREFIAREGFPAAAKHAARALIQSLTKSAGVPV
ncbi:hypothetical protein [Endozoicomonas sp.]|uniref:hypothetical protein n=1 Tax=Endozoicomonas sp. TaxID=1892382 RepID=UPI002885BC02|nr:hypothetical protein [Endozoicomonas sp.]